MTRLMAILLVVTGCTGGNPAADPVLVDIPPGLARWCQSRNGASISCFAWDGARCASWGCAEIPWYSCPEEESIPWAFSCVDGPADVARIEQAVASL